VPVGTRAIGAAVVAGPDGRIVVAGQATLNGVNVIVSARVAADGRLDPSYGLGGLTIVNPGTGAGLDSGAALALLPNGDLVIAGTARSTDGLGPLAFAAIRLLPDGNLDPSFGVGGIATVPIGSEAIANSVAIAGEKILLAGTALVGHQAAAVVRLRTDGSPDPTFGDQGVVTMPETSGVWGMVDKPDGDLALVGQALLAGRMVFMAAQLRANGTPDRSFGEDGVAAIPIGTGADALAVALEPDGKLVLAGDARVGGAKAVAVVRLLPNGSLDRTFGSAGSITFSRGFGVNALALDSAGRIVLAGGGNAVARLTPNGALDPSFGDRGIERDPIGSANSINGLAIQPRDGKLLLAGAADIEGDLMLSVIRLDP
jgi:uncharacterized delta-60 repeat protein